MIKRIKLLVIAALIVASSSLRADEGMWLLPLIQQLNIKEMNKMGLKLTADDIYNINKSSLKDAIVRFGRGCTGEVISDQGLILTNHHCGYGAIQQHSSPEHDYLKDGFWAMSLDEEIPTPGLTVTFLVRIEDVTSQVLAQLNDAMGETEREKAIRKVSGEIASKAKEGTNYDAYVSSFFGGNQFFLLVYEVFKDVRMVGAPPSSIGKFGADTDNWMWPRHTGDFSIFRVYAGKDNKPADYSPDNVPYKPKHSLPVSIKGVKPNDYAMIMGYPGRTQRYMTSWEVDKTIKVTNSGRIKIRGIRQEILLKDMLADRSINIKYASKYAGSSNYWKNSIGMNKALKRLKIFDKKQNEENEFASWVNADPTRKAKYGDALQLIKEGVQGGLDYSKVSLYMGECLTRGTEVVTAASMALDLLKEMEKGDPNAISKEVDALRERATRFFKDYEPSTDRKVAAAMFRLFYNDIDPKYHPDIFGKIAAEYQSNFEAYFDYVFANSLFANPVKFMQFINNPTREALSSDPALIAAKSIDAKRVEIDQLARPFDEMFAKGHRLYIAGKLEMKKGTPMYPDANSTMRLTYGKVKDYYPMDAVHYDYVTTLDGVMEKEDPDNWEFVVPEKLKELYRKKDYGRYGANGKMPVAFITTNDITGGNSGSPVLNGKGELIGCAFDGNWEAMSGDIVFENELQRCINVDIRYVLFIIEKYAGANRLINEMKIVM